MRRFILILAALLSTQSATFANEAIEVQPFVNGQLTYSADANMWPEAARNLTGGAIYALTGAQNILPQANPLSISLSSSSLSFMIDGGGQSLIAIDSASSGSGNARMIDSCPQQTITIPVNSSGSTRTDLLSLQYIQAQTNPHQVMFSNGQAQTVYNSLESCKYSYLQGTTTPPSGYVAFAEISVPNAASVGSQATISYQFPTVQQVLAGVLGGVVTSLSGKSGAVTIGAGTGLLVTNGVSGPTLSLSTPIAVGLGGTGSSAPSLSPGTGITITGSWPFNTVGLLIPISTSSGGNGTISPSLTTGTGLTSSGSWAAQTISLSTPVAINLGGTGTSSPSQVCGYGMNCSGSWPNQTIASTTTIYHNAGLLTSPHIETFNGSINNTTVTLNFGSPYSAAPVCTVSVSSNLHIAGITTVSTTQVSITDAANDSYYVHCIGQ